MSRKECRDLAVGEGSERLREIPSSDVQWMAARLGLQSVEAA